MNKNEGVRVIFVIAFLGLIRILVKQICRILQVYDSENDQIDLMIPAQKSVWKIIHLGQWYGQKCTEFWQAKPNYCTFVLFGWYLRPQCIFFQTDFCVGTMISRHMFGVLYTWIKQQQKFYQNRPYTSKSNDKNGRHSPIFRCVSISISAKFTDIVIKQHLGKHSTTKITKSGNSPKGGGRGQLRRSKSPQFKMWTFW